MNQRLPYFIEKPCLINCAFSCDPEEHFYLLHLTTRSNLNIRCQRCFQLFNYVYENHTKLAFYKDETVASQLMEKYEPIHSKNNFFNLEDLIFDELYLYCPQKHEDCTLNKNNIV